MSYVCCTHKIENTLHSLSTHEYNYLLTKDLSPIKTMFINYASNFDRMFFLLFLIKIGEIFIFFSDYKRYIRRNKD